MRLKNVLQLLFCALCATHLFAPEKISAQTPKPNRIAVASVNTEKSAAAAKSAAASTAAYAEVFAGKVEAEADLKVLTLEMTEDAAEVRAKKLERDLLLRQMRWLEALPASSHAKLTLALGKLVVRKAQAEAKLNTISENYADEHPLVKKARARLAVYTSELEKLLQ